MNEEKQMDGARLSVTDHKQREKEGEREKAGGMRKYQGVVEGGWKGGGRGGHKNIKLQSC